MPLSERQKKIAEIVRQTGPVAGETIARELGLSRAALRSDLAILTMSGILDARPRVGYFYTGKNTLGMLQEELSSITVEDIKSVPIVIGSDKSAYDAVLTMFLEDVGTVFVVEPPDGLLLRGGFPEGFAEGSPECRLRPKPYAHCHGHDPAEQNDLCRSGRTGGPGGPAAYGPRNRLFAGSSGKVEEDPKRLQLIGRVSKTNFTRLLVELAEGKGGNYHS